MGKTLEAPGFSTAERDFSQVDKRRLVAALSRVLPATSLLHEAEDLPPYECDGMSTLRHVPLVVGLPGTEVGSPTFRKRSPSASAGATAKACSPQ